MAGPQRPSADANFAALDSSLARQRVEQIVLTLSFEGRDPEDLAGVQLERHGPNGAHA